MSACLQRRSPAELPGSAGQQHKLLHNVPPLGAAWSLPCCDWAGQHQQRFRPVNCIAGSNLLTSATPDKAAPWPHPKNAADLQLDGAVYVCMWGERMIYLQQSAEGERQAGSSGAIR